MRIREQSVESFRFNDESEYEYEFKLKVFVRVVKKDSPEIFNLLSPDSKTIKLLYSFDNFFPPLRHSR